MRNTSLKIPPCPAPGCGRNVWTLSAANACRRFGLTADEASRVILGRLTRSPHPGEIERSVAKAYGTKAKLGTRILPKEPFNMEELTAASRPAGWFGLDDLRARSPIDPDGCSGMNFLRHLFMPGERVFLTDNLCDRQGLIWEVPPADAPSPNDELRRFADPAPGLGAWFLNNPISGEAMELERLKTANNPQGWTVRAEECVTYPRYLLLESDQAPKHLWIRALALAPLPIVSITDSGGKSLHALVRVDARNADRWKRIVEMIGPKMVRLGADPQAMSLSRLTRLPRSWRDDTGAFQRLVYLNPMADGKSIITMPVRGMERGSL